MASEINLILGDCMIGLHNTPDKYFDLAIVDPPYGIDAGNMTMGRGSRNDSGKNKPKDWDIAPREYYFHELMRVSKNQIIWGGNYFPLPPARCYLLWDKLDYNSDFASHELAWTSFNKVVKCYRRARNCGDEQKIHPTQKPEQLYRWILKNYAQAGMKILDTHVGSGSIAVACYDMGYALTGYEIDAEYYHAAVKRLDIHKQQLTFI